MKLETKRIFISDLPKNVTENEINEKFSNYGEVSSIYIKTRKDIGPKNHSLLFGFVNIQTDHFRLQQCFQDFSNTKWKGDYVELQIAKESFLDRLKRERAETILTDSSKNTVAVNNSLTHSNSPLDTSPIKNGITNKKLKYHSSSSESETETPETDKDATSAVAKLPPTGSPCGADKNDSIGDDIPELVLKSNKFKVLKDKLKIESFGNEPILKMEPSKRKSLDPKRTEADQKRIESMIAMKKGYQQQKSLIQAALSKVDFKPKNKITFNDSETVNEDSSYKKRKYSHTADNSAQKLAKGHELFDDNDEDDVEYNFEVKEQFQGKKGQKLLELQSKYKRDSRFVLDERFLEDGDHEEEHNDALPERVQDNFGDDDAVLPEEKQNELAILEQVLGRKVYSKSTNSDDALPKRKTMLRFDPTQPEHSKYEVKMEEKAVQNNKRKRKTSENKETEKEELPVVSKDQFYEVTDNLKVSLEEKQSFSLLNMFGRKDVEDEKNDIDEPAATVESITKKSIGKDATLFKYDSSDEEEGVNKETVTDQPNKPMNADDNIQRVVLGRAKLWSEPFFFRRDDSRFYDGIHFIKQFETENNSEFLKTRRDLKEIVRAKVRNNQRKNRPFKKKLGGSRKMIKIKKAMKR